MQRIFTQFSKVRDLLSWEAKTLKQVFLILKYILKCLDFTRAEAVKREIPGYYFSLW